ncbi:hypothetical protein [Lichenicola sp.]|uniref:hypothetical protein n=1 Tax=Lichenicola sp. TaxID=2804529 RepID=UPI003B00C6D9
MRRSPNAATRRAAAEQLRDPATPVRRGRKPAAETPIASATPSAEDHAGNSFVHETHEADAGEE